MINYFIELSGRGARFRLQNDKQTWKKVEFNGLEGSEFLTNNTHDLTKLQVFNTPIEIDGQIWMINKESSSLFEPDGELYYNIFVVRDFFPLLPSKEQLTSVIKQGDDRNFNALVLNVYGFFELRARESIGAIVDPTIIFRNETSIPYNGYVGEKAANEKGYIDELYFDALLNWKDHLDTGLTNYFSDESQHGNLDMILLEIENMKAAFESNLESE
ncbi:MAG: hypothetical protein BGO31_16970 [Bacteroidetes bacterium 43-16]|nr:MAG: hypothetical protein BGO31_16970 [Bacteroidetes bacterium 43-16]